MASLTNNNQVEQSNPEQDPEIIQPQGEKDNNQALHTNQGPIEYPTQIAKNNDIVESEAAPVVNNQETNRYAEQTSTPITVNDLRRPQRKVSDISLKPQANPSNEGNYQSLILQSPSLNQQHQGEMMRKKERANSHQMQQSQQQQQQQQQQHSSSHFFGGVSQLTTTSNFNSASTLRFTSPTISFTKANRFPGLKASHLGGSQYDLPTMRADKTTTFGFGEKRIIPLYLERNAREVPSPAKYAQHIRAGSMVQSRSFGIPYKFYAKTYIPKMNIKEPEQCLDIPGVGTYEVQEQVGQTKLKFSILGKGKVFQDMFPSCSPPCNLYSPVEKLVTNGRFSETTFGFGQKYDFTKQSRQTPGPGAYTLPSAFGKFNKRNQSNTNRNGLQSSRLSRETTSTPFLRG